MKRKKTLILIFITVLLGIGIIYYYFLSGPDEFLTEESLKEVFRNFSGGFDVEIQHIEFLSDKHVFVPFKSNDQYGTSHWVWRNRSWDLGDISTIQQPSIWKVDPKDPSTYKVLWNIDEDTTVTDFDVYLVNQRGYRVSNNVHQYTPKIQLHFNVDFESEENSYGMKNIPAEWVPIIENYMDVEDVRQPDASIFDFFHHSGLSFGWIPYDENREIKFPDSPNGHGSGYGEIHLYHMPIIPEHDLE
ncbi:MULTISPECIES: hypothetical protein [Bacillaceae]|uniref:Uncharacterized protein n=1 Tax=Evansella alkalicola TaxID=745819 RepID=A0ABS6JWY0_9BACI|nr:MULTISPECIES: hypothetical protein [Bacillaceae]MBU9723003.1 hypothetical protein [Bacillus alkalicola]